MAEATKRSASSSRGSGASARRGSAKARKTSGGQRSSGSRSNSRSRANSRSGSRVQSTVSHNLKNVGVPVATAAVGAAAGVILGRSRRRPRRVLGIPVPGTRDGLEGIVKEIRRAGDQIGNLAHEVQTTRKKAEDVGKA